MLKYSLLPLERAFAFQITEQSESIIQAIKYIGGSFYASNGWQIKIDACPEIRVTSRTIYLRGTDKDQNLRVDRTWNLSSNHYRDEILSQVKAALSEIISFAQSYPFKYQVGPNAILGVHQINMNPVYDFAPEAEKYPEDFPSESGWGTNRLRHARPILQG